MDIWKEEKCVTNSLPSRSAAGEGVDGGGTQQLMNSWLKGISVLSSESGAKVSMSTSSSSSTSSSILQFQRPPPRPQLQFPDTTGYQEPQRHRESNPTTATTFNIFMGHCLVIGSSKVFYWFFIPMRVKLTHDLLSFPFLSSLPMDHEVNLYCYLFSTAKFAKTYKF